MVARNQADGIVHATRKTLQEAGDKVTDDEKSSIEAAIAEVELALKGSDKAAIETATQKLTEASLELTQRMMAEQAGAAQADGGNTGDASGDSDAVDAEFEEVKDDKRA